MAAPKKAKLVGCPSESPKAGDVYVCEDCKHTIQVVRDCGCGDTGDVAFACCGSAMTKAN